VTAGGIVPAAITSASSRAYSLVAAQWLMLTLTSSAVTHRDLNVNANRRYL
jgi:hypothetical protein